MKDAISHKIEITPEMVSVGLRRLYQFHITEPDENEMRNAVAEVYKVMCDARLRCRSEIGELE